MNWKSPQIAVPVVVGILLLVSFSLPDQWRLWAVGTIGVVTTLYFYLRFDPNDRLRWSIMLLVATYLVGRNFCNISFESKSQFFNISVMTTHADIPEVVVGILFLSLLFALPSLVSKKSEHEERIFTAIGAIVFVTFIMSIALVGILYPVASHPSVEPIASIEPIEPEPQSKGATLVGSEPKANEEPRVLRKPPIESDIYRLGDLRDSRSLLNPASNDSRNIAKVNNADLEKAIIRWECGQYDDAAKYLKNVPRLAEWGAQGLILNAESIRLASRLNSYSTEVGLAKSKLEEYSNGLVDGDLEKVLLRIAIARMESALGNVSLASGIVNLAIGQLDNFSLTDRVRIGLYLDCAEIFANNGSDAAALNLTEKAKELTELEDGLAWARHFSSAFSCLLKSKLGEGDSEREIAGAIDWFKKQNLQDERTIAHLEVWHSDVLLAHEKRNEAVVAINRAISWAKESRDNRAQHLWNHRLAAILLNSDNDRAKNLLKECTSYWENTTPTNKIALATGRFDLSMACLNLGQFDEAIASINSNLDSRDISSFPVRWQANWYQLRASIYKWMSKSDPTAAKSQDLLSKSLEDLNIAIAKYDFGGLKVTQDYCMALVARSKLFELQGEKDKAQLDITEAKRVFDRLTVRSPLLGAEIEQRLKSGEQKQHIIFLVPAIMILAVPLLWITYSRRNRDTPAELQG